MTLHSKTQYSSLVEKYGNGTRQVFDPSEYRERLLDWVGLDKSPRQILDIGCGEGTFTNFLDEEFANGVQVVGIDNTPEMIELAHAQFPQIDFRVESMDQLSLDDNSVDFVFSRFAVHYSTDLLKTLAEVGRVTRSGGRFFLKEIHPTYAMFYKRSRDYEAKENATFTTQGDDGVQVTHPTFTMQEYINGFSTAGWDLKLAYEIYGRDAAGEKIAPYRVPTSICFVLQKQ